jgi:hypothetical protein
MDTPEPPPATDRAADLRGTPEAPPGRGVTRRRRTPVLATTLGGLALVLAFRALYLLRFGFDPCWMNDNFLFESKAMRFGYAVELRMPLVRLFLSAMRNAGASANMALGVAYLTAHTLFALGVFALGRTVLGHDADTAHDARAISRARASVAIAVAILPALATDSGYRNISCTVGAGLFVALAALLVTGPARPLRLAAAFLLAVSAASCRPESALCVAGLTFALAVGGRRFGAAGRAGAVITAAGLIAGLLLVPQSNQQVAAASGPSAQIWGSYSFYAFYNQSPFVLRLISNLYQRGSTATEYLRYAEAVRLLGGFAENGGSILHALLHHPKAAAIWLAVKPLDLPITIVLFDSFTPLVIILLFLAGRRLRRQGLRSVEARWAPLIGAFAAPLAFLLFWSSGHAPYLLFMAPLLLLVALWGLEPWVTRAPVARLRAVAVGAVVLGALLVGLHGHPVHDYSTAPVLREAARWLEQRCAGDGCLVNAVPPAIDVQTWANLEAGAPMPLKDKRAEAFALKRFPPWYLEQVRWDHRLAEARAHGWRGPILYVRATMRSVTSFDYDFHPEHRLEGAPDLTGAKLAATFRDGDDLVEIFEIAPGAATGTPPTPAPAG